ncbi:PRC-barrel domain-containing protein [Brachybacterium sp. AOP25-B2-12]|uniref:PRC-barrel domain-containing protein n=1 Tax=Brachybacterium sp. AOP25-B2-12 TaxID=3457710 RepID=UPI0040336793
MADPGTPEPPAGEGPGLDIRALATAGVLDADGRRVGRVHDVFLVDRTGDLAAVSVALGRLSVREVLVPADLLRDAGDGQVQVTVGREALRAGMATPAEGHVEPAGIRAARAALLRITS